MPSLGLPATSPPKLGQIFPPPRVDLGGQAIASPFDCLLVARLVDHSVAARVLAEHAMYDGIHLGADPYGLHDLDAEAGDQVARDDDLSDEAHAQEPVLRLDDHDSLALD